MLRMRFSSQNARFSLLLSFVIICNIVICETKVTCNQKDKQILLCFKNGLIDQSGMLSTWSNKQDCCKWTGVHCNINGRVTHLSLPCLTKKIYRGKENKTHCLAGKIHLTLFELEFLNYLDLSNNDFKAIHSSLDCQNLSLVNISHGSANTSKSNLVDLNLSKNENLVIDDLRWLLRISQSLETLNLDFINMHSETQWLQILTMFPLLSVLYLRNCLLKSASPSLQYANFTSLEYLDLSYNQFISELPVWLFNVSGLLDFSLEGNHFHGQIPETLLNLQNLNSLYLTRNNLSGTIPDWFCQLGGLNDLVLDENSFTSSIPTCLGNLSSLIVLDLHLNYLTGSLPESLGNLSNLEVLLVGANSLSGVVSDRNFANLSKLKSFGFCSPSLVFDFNPHWIPPFKLDQLHFVCGKINLPWIYTQTSLTFLYISYCSFTKESQDMFWSWAFHIRLIRFEYNDMPWDMSNVLLNSKLIYMAENGMSGGLPQLTSNVIAFVLVVDNISGSLSPLLCHNKMGNFNLKYLDVSENLLSGELTECWVKWKSLIHVSLGRNNLTGIIPHAIGTLSNLMSLHIDNNKFNGEIPMSLKNCKKLVIINLCNNKFSGNIPTWIGQHVKVLQLRSNEFNGDIPPQICRLSSLIVLDLANNRLTGTIPHCLNNMTTMIIYNASTSDVFGIIISTNSFYGVSVPLLAKGNYLDYFEYMHDFDLSNNHLSGKIPSEVFRLVALQSLNLSHNQLTGTIPEEIGNMKALESLDFSNNTLSGQIPQSMSALSFLEVLNLSFNNLKGQIPLGTQLQGFTSLSYMGNPELCGTPLIDKCNNDEAPNGDTKVKAENDEDGFMESFYISMGVGFAVSFWIVFGSILLKRSWRHAYFNFLYDVKDKFMTRCS